MMDIKESMKNDRRESTCENSVASSFNEKLVLGSKKTQEKRNFAATDFSISRSTEKKYKKEFGIGNRDCQFKTDARVQAEKDPRNMFSFACMNEAFCSILLAFMIFNWDATQFVINPDGSCRIVYVKYDPDCEDPFTSLSSGGVCCYSLCGIDSGDVRL